MVINTIICHSVHGKKCCDLYVWLVFWTMHILLGFLNMFQKLNLFPWSSSIRKERFILWTKAERLTLFDRIFTPPHLTMDTDPVSEKLCSKNAKTMDYVQNSSYVYGCTALSETFRNAYALLLILGKFAL